MIALNALQSMKQRSDTTHCTSPTHSMVISKSKQSNAICLSSSKEQEQGPPRLTFGYELPSWACAYLDTAGTREGYRDIAQSASPSPV
jgi:hypothetical protein